MELVTKDGCPMGWYTRHWSMYVRGVVLLAPISTLRHFNSAFAFVASIDLDEVVSIFARHLPRRMELAGVLKVQILTAFRSVNAECSLRWPVTCRAHDRKYKLMKTWTL